MSSSLNLCSRSVQGVRDKFVSIWRPSPARRNARRCNATERLTRCQKKCLFPRLRPSRSREGHKAQIKNGMCAVAALGENQQRHRRRQTSASCRNKVRNPSRPGYNFEQKNTERKDDTEDSLSGDIQSYLYLWQITKPRIPGRPEWVY